MWARLSLKYSTPVLNFAKIDIEILPSIANEFKISNSGFFSQLPYLILFKNGEVEETYPGKDSKGRAYQAKFYREKEIVKIFDLENIYLSSVNSIPKNSKVN